MTVTALAALGAVTFGVSGAAGSSNDVFQLKLGKAKAGSDTTHITNPAIRGLRLPNGRAVPTRTFLKKYRRAITKKFRMKARSSRLRPMSHAPGHPAPVVGDSYVWTGLNSVTGGAVLKFFTLRGIGVHGEVWVANNLNFQAGDCRNDGVRNVITDAQVNYLLHEFDTNIWPKEADAFSVAPDRDGSNEIIRSLVPPAIGALMHPEGAGNRTVILIDNVRDENYFDLNNSQGFSYIAGFFSSTFNLFFDRNVMTIDSWDWLHRTGANPPHQPSSNLCTSAPARPFLYEGVFAHEYQHLLESYASPGEQSWVNEGLSDWAITLTGYGDPSKPVTEIGFDSHTQCFLGNLGIVTDANPIGRNGGPENSLTLWGDQGDDEILCDYGAAYTLMEYLHGQYGTAFMTALHNQDLNGLAGLQRTLSDFQAGVSARETIHRWAMMVAVDRLLDHGRQLRGGDADAYRTPTLDAAINWGNPDAFSEPGAPPNGSDYLQLNDAAGNPLKLNEIRSLSFNGASTLPPHPIEWTVDANPPGQAGDPALYSGTGDLFDRAIVRSVTVAGADPNLRFNAQWNLEDGWDFTFVQVSTNGGQTYQSVRCTSSRPTLAEDPATYPAVSNIRVHFPGYTGDSAGWKAETCNLSAFAGQTILVSFRNMTDPNTQGATDAIPPGFWLDDVTLGGTLLSDGSSLTGWQSATQARPIPVEGFTVQLLAYKQLGTSPVRIAKLRLNGNNDATVNARQLAALLGEGNNVDRVAAIVMYDESTESIGDYAPYTLTVN